MLPAPPSRSSSAEATRIRLVDRAVREARAATAADESAAAAGAETADLLTKLPVDLLAAVLQQALGLTDDALRVLADREGVVERGEQRGRELTWRRAKATPAKRAAPVTKVVGTMPGVRRLDPDGATKDDVLLALWAIIHEKELAGHFPHALLTLVEKSITIPEGEVVVIVAGGS